MKHHYQKQVNWPASVLNNFLMLAEIGQHINQLQNKLIKLKSDVCTMYKYIDAIDRVCYPDIEKPKWLDSYTYSKYQTT